MVTETLLTQLSLLEQPIVYFQPPPAGNQSFKWINGRIPLLISAPHATTHLRRGRLKREEGYTGALAQLLAKETGAFALYTCYRSQDDSNWDKMTPYKALLQKLVQKHNIRFVIDLHGMSNRHKFGLAIGTRNGRSCPKRETLITTALQTHQFIQTTEKRTKGLDKMDWHRFVFNHSRFTGGLVNHTITRFVNETLKTSAVQIEICTSLRIVNREDKQQPSFSGNKQGITKTFNALAEVIQQIAAV